MTNLNAPPGFYLCYEGTRILGHCRTFKTRDQAEFVKARDRLDWMEVVERGAAPVAEEGK